MFKNTDRNRGTQARKNEGGPISAGAGEAMRQANDGGRPSFFLPSLGPAISGCIFDIHDVLLKIKKNIYIYSHGGICFEFYYRLSKCSGK